MSPKWHFHDQQQRKNLDSVKGHRDTVLESAVRSDCRTSLRSTRGSTANRKRDRGEKVV